MQRIMFTKLSLLCAFCLLAVTLNGASQAQDFTSARWSTAVELGVGWFPSIAIDRTGRIHVAWYGGYRDRRLGNSDLFMYTVRRPQENWLDPIDVIFTGEGGLTIRNAIDISPDGVLYALYRDGTEHHFAAAPVDYANISSNWQELADFNNNAYYLDMIVDQNGVIHAVSSEQGVNLETIDTGDLTVAAIRERFPCAFCSDLIYRRSTDGGRTWSFPRNISQTIEGSERVDMFEGASGRLYITWDEGSDWYISQGEYQDVRMVYSEDGGLSWSEPVILTGNRQRSHPTQFTLTEMRDGTLFGVWRYGTDADRRIYFQTSTDVGQTWSDPEPVPYILTDFVSASILDKYDLVTDLAGAVHLVAVGYDEVTDQGPALYHLEYRQDRWLPPNRIYYNPQIKRPEWPTLEVGPRNDLHVTWFIRVGDGRNAADVGSLYIYYAERSATLPDNPVLTAYLPTMTPVLRPTSTPAFAATPTAFPTLMPLDPNVNVNRNRDQYAMETLLGATLAAAVLCVGLLFVMGFRPRL